MLSSLPPKPASAVSPTSSRPLREEAERQHHRRFRSGAWPAFPLHDSPFMCDTQHTCTPPSPILLGEPPLFKLHTFYIIVFGEIRKNIYNSLSFLPQKTGWEPWQDIGSAKV